jgi:hypothetical protein
MHKDDENRPIYKIFVITVFIVLGLLFLKGCYDSYQLSIHRRFAIATIVKRETGGPVNLEFKFSGKTYSLEQRKLRGSRIGSRYFAEFSFADPANNRLVRPWLEVPACIEKQPDEGWIELPTCK